ncbi:LTA synthase family protein [Frateuria sp.]|uniref:LTA synthase family protein n=1 Tax=Frateuria sp. TaxID=2211372 RepID=UPI003F7DD7E3
MLTKFRDSVGPSFTHRSELTRTLWFFALALFFVLVATFIDGASDVRLAAAFQRPWPVIANAIPGLLLAWLLLVLSRRALFSFWVATVAYLALAKVNQIKVANLQTPLLPQDISFLRTIDASSMHLFGAYAGSLLVVALGLVALVAITVLLFILEAPLMARGWKGRATPTFLLICALLAFGPVGHVWRHLYGGSYFTVVPWSPLKTSRKSGLLNELGASYLAYRDAGRIPPPSEKEAGELLKRYAGPIRAGMDTVSEEAAHPDIIIIQSEAFFDPSVLNRIERQEVLTRFHVWQARGASGRLHVPTFGGGTIRTEFEVLTGISLRSLPSVDYPYLQLSYTSLRGLVSNLNQHGYDTYSIHANGGGFWNRESNFQALGFKHRVWRDAFSKKAKYEGLYVSDKSMTDQIIDVLDHGESDAPRFIFAISIENHGPYAAQPGINWADWKALRLPAGLDDKTAYDLRSYLYHLDHVDIELDRLLNHVMASPRPTMVVFYGDHLPSLVPAFEKLGFRDGTNMLQQTVPWLMIGNFGDLGVPNGDIASWMLPGIVLHAAGVNDDVFLTLKRMLPRDLANLTHSPWIKDESLAPKQEKLLSQLTQIDRLRLEGDFVNLAGLVTDGDGASVRVTGSVLGSYITPDFQVGGVGNTFAVNSPLFAKIDVVGSATELTIQARLQGPNQVVLREAGTQLNLDGTASVNLDLRDGRPLTPGWYQLCVLLNGTQVKSYRVQITGAASPRVTTAARE